MKSLEQEVNRLFQDINSVYTQDYTEGEILLIKSIMNRALEDAINSKDLQIKRLREALEDAEEALVNCCDYMDHYYDVGCLPSLEELRQVSQATGQATLALKELK